MNVRARETSSTRKEPGCTHQDWRAKLPSSRLPGDVDNNAGADGNGEGIMLTPMTLMCKKHIRR